MSQQLSMVGFCTSFIFFFYGVKLVDKVFYLLVGAVGERRFEDVKNLLPVWM